MDKLVEKIESMCDIIFHDSRFLPIFNEERKQLFHNIAIVNMQEHPESLFIANKFRQFLQQMFYVYRSFVPFFFMLDKRDDVNQRTNTHNLNQFELRFFSSTNFLPLKQNSIDIMVVMIDHKDKRNKEEISNTVKQFMDEKTGKIYFCDLQLPPLHHKREDGETDKQTK